MELNNTGMMMSFRFISMGDAIPLAGRHGLPEYILMFLLIISFDRMHGMLNNGGIPVDCSDF